MATFESLTEGRKLILAAIDLWRKRLVSFDGNNRQIFYKEKKVGDVNLDDEWCDESVIEAFLAGSRIKVSSIYSRLIAKINPAAAQKIAGVDSVNEESPEGDENDYVRLWATRLRKFESVYRKTREDNDERNIDTCFVAKGFATWQPKLGGTTSIPNAPVILYQTKIEAIAKGNSDFALTRIQEPILNEALCLYLEKEFGVERSVFEIDAESLSISSDGMKKMVAKIKETVPGFRIIDRTLLGNFAFQYYPMVMDLQRIETIGTNHVVLGALAGIDSHRKQMSERGEEKDVEELSVLSPAQESLVFSVDSSQHSAISAIMGGKNLVVQGPPGTGKSQTIANVIAESAAQGKTVLFVAEKRAAIDAVLERLGDRGLDSIVLDLHGEPDRKTVAKNLTKALKTHEFAPDLSSLDSERLFKAKKALQERWKWLHSTTDINEESETSLSVWDLLKTIGELRAEMQILNAEELNIFVPNIQSISSKRRDLISSHIENLFDWGYFEDGDRSPLIHEIASKLDTSQKADSAIQIFNELKGIVRSREYLNIIEVSRKIRSKPQDDFLWMRDTLTAFESARRALKEWNVEKTSEILELMPAYEKLRTFCKTKQLSLIKGFLQRRKERATLGEIRLDKTKISAKEMRASLANFSTAFTNWQSMGGKEQSLFDSSIDLEGLILNVSRIDTLRSQLESIFKNLSLFASPQREFSERLDEISGEFFYLSKAPNIIEARNYFDAAQLNSLIECISERRYERQQSILLWEYLWYSENLKRQIANHPELLTRGSSMESAISDFHRLDEKKLDTTPKKIINSVNKRFSSSTSDGRQVLHSEAKKSRGYLPFRELVDKATSDILTIKPCFAMSPLAVSKLLPTREGMFDIVIFDEASQIKPENAITAIYRGKQVVVAGDRYQLPPTTVGQSQAGTGDFDENEIEGLNLQTQDMESILDAVASVLPATGGNIKPLRLHYRSKDERLISWSNFHIYKEANEELFSFPSITKDSETVLRYTYLPGVKTQSMGQPNEVEIQEVIKEVKKHIKLNPELSLGVIAFGSRHAIRLQDAFNLLERQDSDFYSWKTEWNARREKFFIKNIERVQGDERDAIIISPGYAPNLQGDVLLQFGTLNNAGGERRLNVAASRAKSSLHLITSLKSTDIDLSRSKSRSIALFKSFLSFMENSGRLEEIAEGYSVPQSPFEQEIFDALTQRGLAVDCQVGDSKYKIDFAIRHPKNNKYVLAIEADGWTYHSSPYARERDWLRQDVLERKGWSFVRVWSTDWWDNPEREIKRILDAYQSAINKKREKGDEMPAVKAAKVEEESVFGDVNKDYEFTILNSLVSSMPNLNHEELLRRWMNQLGLKRRTSNLLERFEGYLREIKRPKK